MGAAAKPDSREGLKTAAQVFGIACLALLFLAIYLKGYTDVALIAEKYSGVEFWSALAKYLLGNLAGGKAPG